MSRGWEDPPERNTPTIPCGKGDDTTDNPRQWNRAVLAAVFTGGPARPRTMLLRAIRWYQANVSAGRDRCPRDGVHCSAYGVGVVARYGALVGGVLAVRYVLTCSVGDERYKAGPDNPCAYEAPTNFCGPSGRLLALLLYVGNGNGNGGKRDYGPKGCGE